MAHTADMLAERLTPRRADAFAAAQRRSVFVRRLRIALLAGIGLIALNIVLQNILRAPDVSGGTPEQPTGELERIVNPRFIGRDEDGTPFVVTADSAVRRPGSIVGLTELENPRLDYSMLGEGLEAGPGAVLANLGVYNPDTRSLELNQAVNLSTRSGYRFETPSATIQLPESRIVGEEPVYGEAPWGAIRAGGFEVHEEGRRVIFTDGVTTRLYLNERSDETRDTETGP
ncbi:LPS export ABC transporter periplasmic protein LptC [Marinicauda pacifica]|uniref:LPS export ABC transporter periplasmic protein LptC n=1 Tax=Marinicauda pacifica TaxID=1133559 RepID=UPI0035C82F7C